MRDFICLITQYCTILSLTQTCKLIYHCEFVKFIKFTDVLCLLPARLIQIRGLVIDGRFNTMLLCTFIKRLLDL